MKTITLIGIKTDSGLSEVTIENEAPIASILSAELLVALHAHNSFQVLNGNAPGTQSDFVGIKDGAEGTLAGNPRIGADGTAGGGGSHYFVSSSSENATRKKLTVVADTPSADEIQLTDINKFKLNIDPGMSFNDMLILKVMIIGEVMRP